MKRMKKILIIEDNEMNIQVLQEMLEDNYNLIISTNGYSGIDNAVKTRPDLILLDIMLPDVNGFQIAKELKTFNSTKEIPILFISAVTNENVIKSSSKLGVEGYIVKPFQKEKLENKILEIITSNNSRL